MRTVGTFSSSSIASRSSPSATSMRTTPPRAPERTSERSSISGVEAAMTGMTTWIPLGASARRTPST